MANPQEYFRDLVATAQNQRASDIHLISDSPPIIRRDGRLYSVGQPLHSQHVAEILSAILPPERYAQLVQKRELDFSFAYNGLRVRGNAYFEKNNPATSLRLISPEVPTPDNLGLPEVLLNFTNTSQGLVLITGPTGHGKSTTMAALVERINASQTKHIITLEDPIEFVFKPQKSIISQREVGSDTLSFSAGLRAALREDPDIIMVGEMRDLETIETALTLAETGHLVMATMHTNSAAQTADRIIDVFPGHKQPQIRLQLASVLVGVISQRLLPRIGGGRVLAAEILVATPAVRNLIREGNIFQIPNVIQTSAADGMVGLDGKLSQLVSQGMITLDEALIWSLDPKSLKMQLYH